MAEGSEYLTGTARFADPNGATGEPMKRFLGILFVSMVAVAMAAPAMAKKVKPPRTHWDMLLERRSVEELDELLKERLDIIKTRRRGG